MGMGGPGDHPLTDMLVWNLHPFPPDIEAMLREVLEVDSGFPDGKRKYIEQVEWSRRFFDWEQGENLDEGREALALILSEIKNTKEK